MAGRFKKAFRRARKVLREQRKALYVMGGLLLALGLAFDFLFATTDDPWLVFPGIAFPVLGSILLFVNYIVAHSAKGAITYEDAQDEAFFGSMIYLYLGLCVISMLIMVPSVLEYLEDKSSALYVATPKIVILTELTGIPLMLYFLFIVSAILLSFNALTKHGFLTYLRIMRGQEVPPECCDPDQLFGNVISTIVWSLFAYFFFVNAFYLILLIAGVDVTVPDIGDDLSREVYVMSRAAVWEEVTDRVLLIGLPLLAIDFLFRRGRVLKLRQYLLGGGMSFGQVESGAVLFSAIMFGLSHVEYWDLYKVLPTVVAGLFLGYLFVKYGLYASIMLHFAVDFFNIPLDYLGWDGSVPIAAFMVGFVAFCMYSSALLRFVAHKLMGFPEKPRPPPKPLLTEDEIAEMTKEPTEDDLAARTRGYANTLAIIAGVCVFMSAGIMLWASYDIATDPEYGGLGTTENLVGWCMITIPNSAAVVLLLACMFRPETRLMMVAAMLSGFSFLGVFAILAQVCLWRANSKFGLQWKYVRKRDDEPWSR